MQYLLHAWRCPQRQLTRELRDQQQMTGRRTWNRPRYSAGPNKLSFCYRSASGVQVVRNGTVRDQVCPGMTYTVALTFPAARTWQIHSNKGSFQGATGTWLVLHLAALSHCRTPVVISAALVLTFFGWCEAGAVLTSSA